MLPYRPLFVCIDEPLRRDRRELHGLALMLIVLGALRLLPSIVTHEPIGIETTAAAAMFACGIAIAIDLPGACQAGPGCLANAFVSALPAIRDRDGPGDPSNEHPGTLGVILTCA